MPADVQIRFRATSAEARRDINQLLKEVTDLRQQLGQTGSTSQRALATLESSSDEARRETLRLRKEITDLNAEIAQNTRLAVKADAATRASLAEKNRALRAEQGLSRVQQQRSSQALAGLTHESREIRRLANSQEETTRTTRNFSRFTSELTGNLASFGVELGVIGAINLGRNFVEASTQMDGFRQSLIAVTGDANVAEMQLSELLELARDPGITARGAIREAVNLQVIGLEFEDATVLIMEFGNALALVGQTDLSPALLGLRQIIQRGRLSQEELNQITERVGIASKALRNAFGSVLAQDIQKSLDASGKSIEDFVDIFVEELGKEARASVDTTLVAFQRLQNSTFELSSALGDKLRPAVTAVTRGLTAAADAFTDIIKGEVAFEETLQGANTALGRNDAIERRIKGLRELVAEQERAVRTAGFFQHRPTLEAQAESSRTELQELERVTAGDPAKIAELREELAGLGAELARINDAQTELNEADGLERFFSQFSPENLHTLEEADIAINKQIDSTESLLAAVEEVAAGVVKAAQDRASAEKEAAETAKATDKTTKTVKAATVAYTEYRDVLSEGLRQIQEFSELNQELEGFGDFWRVAAGQAGEYTTAVDLAVVNHQKELEALDAIFEGFADPLQENIDRYGTLSRAIEKLSEESLSYAADQAIATAEIKLVNPAISDAAENMRLYIREMDDLQGAFEGTDDISDRLTTSIREQASAFDELRRSVDGVAESQSGLQGQQLGSGIFDQFDARTPGSDFGTSFADNLRPLQAQIGQELASQAISTAGELRRIEEDRVESLEDLEQEYSERILAINEEKRQKLAEVEQAIEAERVRRLASIQGAFEEAKNAEVEARQEAADRILDIERDAAEQRNRLGMQLNANIFELEQERDARIRELNEGLVERERERQQEILSITEQATQARSEAEQRYADRVQEINNQLVESIRDIQSGLQEEIESLESGFVQRHADRADEIVRITQEAANARATANQTFTETMEGIYTNLVTAWDTLEEGFTERQADRAEERIEIEQRAADARVAANEGYADRLARISTDLVDEVRRIESEIVDVQQRHAEDRLAIEQESIESRAEANEAYARQVEDIEVDRDRQLEEQARRLQEIQETAAGRRLDAERDLASDIQDIQNRLVDNVIDIQNRLADTEVEIQRDLNDTLNDLRDDALDAERYRQQSFVDLHEETQQKLEDLERTRTQTVEDLRRRFQDDQLDAATRLDRDLQDAEGDPEREAAARERFQRRISDLTREFHRQQRDLQITQSRQQEAIARTAAAREIELARRAQAELAGIAAQETVARTDAAAGTAAAQTQAQAGIADAESAAGVAFQEAQQHYVPALSAHEQALLTHAETLNRINQGAATATEAVNQARSEAIQAGLDEVSAAATALSEALTAVTTAEQERLGVLGTETSAAVGDLQAQRSAAETQAGLTFDEALANYTPAVDLNTQALQALTAALDAADIERISALGALDATGTEDRLTTQTAQRELAVGAGVSIEDARANFVPALSSAAQATLTLNATMRELDTSFRETISEIQNAGLIDRQSVDLAIQTAIAEAAAQQTALETQAGTTFTEASAAFTPGLSDISQAGVDRDTAFGDIASSETEEIDALNAQSIADRLETDAAITETRDVFLKASAQETLKYQTEIRQINNAMRIDIREVNKTLQVNLESIDDKLDADLAEIRELKTVFDTRISAMITAINEQGNLDVANLKADTAAMRSSLEAIAEEARDNAWKNAILKVANVGITIAGVAAGTALGNPVAGLAIGQAVGGLVEQGGNELFHFEQTDRIARRISRSAALNRPRPAPAYLPDSNQIRNSRDISREIVAGLTEGLEQRSRRDGGFGGASQQSGFPEEITATVQIQFPDGTVQELRDQIIRLEAQDR